ncbi:MAG: methyltransferase [Pseudonocardia sp.]
MTLAAPTPPVTDRRELSRLAYGFMASQALFAALGVDLFGHLAGGPRTVAELAGATGVPPHRMRTLLAALAAVGLVVADGDGFVNAPASARHLVGADGLGEYFRLQIAQQIYPAMTHLAAGITGTGTAFDTLAGLLADSGQAQMFTAAQHAGSLGPARALAARVPLPGAARLLDVGGGSGAFATAFCAANPGLRATVLDLPRVVEAAAGFVREPVTLLAADAARDPWPGDQDVVLMSYLLSALADAEIDVVLARARAALHPGGTLIVHDFLLDDDRRGPAPAALWFLQYLAYRPDAVSFTGTELAERLAGHGFEPVTLDILIPEITGVILARRGPS